MGINHQEHQKWQAPFLKAVPDRRSRLQTGCLPTSCSGRGRDQTPGSPLDDGNTPLQDSSGSKHSQIRLPDRGIYICKDSFPTVQHCGGTAQRGCYHTSPTTSLQDPADLCETHGKGKNTALSLFSPSSLCLSVPESNVRRQNVNF